MKLFAGRTGEFTLYRAYDALLRTHAWLPTQMFPRLPARAAFLADTSFVSGTQKVFLILFRHVVSATNVAQFLLPKNIMINNVSSFATTSFLGPWERGCVCQGLK